MIDMCVTLLEDCFETADLKTSYQFSNILIEKVYKDNSSILINIKEMYPKLEKFLKLQLSFFHCSFCVNEEYIVQKGLKIILGVRNNLKRIFLKG